MNKLALFALSLLTCFSFIYAIDDLDNMDEPTRGCACAGGGAAGIYLFNKRADERFIQDLLKDENLLPQSKNWTLEQGSHEFDFDGLKIKVENNTGYVYKIGNKPVGFIHFWTVGDSGYIARLVVSRPNRKKGYGSQLMKKAIGQMKNLKMKRIIIQNRPSLKWIAKWYEKLGFKPKFNPALGDTPEYFKLNLTPKKLNN